MPMYVTKPVCPLCKGTGVVIQKIKYKVPYSPVVKEEIVTYPCPRCNATGILVTKSIGQTYLPPKERKREYKPIKIDLYVRRRGT